MPRVYASNSDPHDFCWHCFPSWSVAVDKFGDVGVGPDHRGNCFDYKADHPPYEETDYKCEECGEPLGEEDDGWD